MELQLCQLHHLLVRAGLGDNRRQSSSVSRPSLCLNRTRARRRGRPAAEQRRHLSSVRRSWPRLSAPNACMKSTASSRAEWTRPLPLCLAPLARNAAAVSFPRNPPVSRHFLLPPNRVAVTIFSGEPNAEPCEASRRLCLGPRGCLGS